MCIFGNDTWQSRVESIHYSILVKNQVFNVNRSSYTCLQSVSHLRRSLKALIYAMTFVPKLDIADRATRTLGRR